MRSIFLAACSLACWLLVSADFNLVPLTTVDAIDRLGKHRHSNHSQQLTNLKNLGHHLNLFWNEGFVGLQSAQFFPNLSPGCALQIEQFVSALKEKNLWSLSVIDSFGKLPSGLMEGNLAWLGEFTECFNISALNDTWKGKYALFSTPVDPLEMFKPGASLVFKYGLCMPNNCSQRDITEIVNFVLNPVPSETNMLKMHINESFILVKDPKVLSTGAISTITLLAVFIMVGLLASMFDIYKRYKFEVRYVQLSSLSALAVDDGINDVQVQEASEANLNSQSDSKDLDQLYLEDQENDSLFSRVFLNFSAVANAKKVFRNSSNSSSNLSCLNGIRVLSLAWIILGHTYIFAFGFSDNINIVTRWMKQFHLMIISNAMFSVDSFFLLSGFLTCYVFMREINHTGLCVFQMIKYYIHRLWRLTPLYAIVYLISLNLSPFLGDSPLYPPTGVEPDYCKYNWWINFLYLNNLINPDKMCFGLAWYLANDTQFHVVAPIILIPLALKKKTFALALSGVFLVANSIAIALTMYFHPGMDAAQYGSDFNRFFIDFYVLPWCRIGPYIVGILAAHFYMQHKKGFRLNKLLDYFLWFISLLTLGLLLFGLYPDALGEHPLSRETRIFYQSVSRTVWAAALGYIIYSCALSKSGIVNKVLSCPIWQPLSKINYSAFLIHVLVIIYFNAIQEHLIHMQHSILISSFVMNWIVSYALAFFIHIFCEAPLIGLEKFMF